MTVDVYALRRDEYGRILKNVPEDYAEAMVRTMRLFQDPEGDYWIITAPHNPEPVPLPK